MQSLAHQHSAQDHNQHLKLPENFSHPVERIQNNYLHQQKDLTYLGLSNVFGTHMVMRMEMERRALSTPLRLPALKSEYAGLDTITKRDLDIGYEDVFNADGCAREDVRVDLHQAMEQRLGLVVPKPVM